MGTHSYDVDLTYQKIRSAANPSYRFIVDIAGIPVGAFTECTLPMLEFDVKEVKEGGVNTYTHCLPGRVKKSKLVLKNGIGLGSVLIPWFTVTLKGTIKRQRVNVILQNMKKQKVMTWVIEDCLPVKWTAPQLKSDGKAIAIQTLEMVCGEIDCVYTPQSGTGGKWSPSPHVPSNPRATMGYKPAPHTPKQKRGGALFNPIRL